MKCPVIEIIQKNCSKWIPPSKHKLRPWYWILNTQGPGTTAAQNTQSPSTNNTYKLTLACHLKANMIDTIQLVHEQTQFNIAQKKAPLIELKTPVSQSGLCVSWVNHERRTMLPFTKPYEVLLLLLKMYWRLTNNKIVYFRHQLVWSVDQNDLLRSPLFFFFFFFFFYSLPQICYFKVLKNKTIALISRVIL